MGEFHCRVVERGRTVKEFTAPNALHYEGVERILRQVFPPLQVPLAFQIGIAAPTLRTKSARPNPISSTNLDYAETLVLDDFEAGNEGGAYVSTMRDAMDYARQPIAFAVSAQSLGAAIESDEVEFTNAETWAQHPADWDNPATAGEIESTPPPWHTPPWEGSHGYPWQHPRIKHDWMQQYDGSGELDWLIDFRKFGGFPVLNAFVVDTVYGVVIASSVFRAPVLLRPGLSLHIQYRARIDNVSQAFATRLAGRAFAGSGSAYESIYARPLLVSAGTPRETWTYDDVVDHFSDELIAISIDDWTFVPYDEGPPEITPHVVTDLAPVWVNESETELVVAHVAVYGEVAGTPELMFCIPIDSVALAENDQLRAPDGIVFRLKGI